MYGNRTPTGLNEHDAAYCAAAWASGETQRSLAKTFGYQGSSSISVVIDAFLIKYGRERPRYKVCYGDDRKAFVPEALARFKATLTAGVEPEKTWPWNDPVWLRALKIPFVAGETWSEHFQRAKDDVERATAVATSETVSPTSSDR